MSKLVESIIEDWNLWLESGPGVSDWRPMPSTYARELLAHIERLEANQVPEGCVAVPRELAEAIVSIFGGDWNEDLVDGGWAKRANHTIQWFDRVLKATHKPHSTDSESKGE